MFYISTDVTNSGLRFYRNGSIFVEYTLYLERLSSHLPAELSIAIANALDADHYLINPVNGKKFKLDIDTILHGGKSLYIFIFVQCHRCSSYIVNVIWK